MDAVIALTVCNRPEYLSQVLDSWSKVRGIENYVMWFFVEPDSEDAKKLLRKVDFCVSEIVQNDRRYGPLTNPWRAFDTCFGEANIVILGEDDSIVGTDLLVAMEWIDWRYADDEEVLAACAFQIREGQRGSRWRKQKKFHSTVWATWMNRWDDVLRETWDHDYSKRGWDWNINDNLLKDRYVVAPEMSRSQHIGRIGTHCTPDMFDSLQAPNFLADYRGGYVEDSGDG